MSSASPPTTFVFEEIQSPSRISTPLAMFLEKLDAIPSSTIPSGFIRNTKLLNSLYAKKQQQIDVIVGEFASLYTIPINFIALFEQRMLTCGNTLTRQQTEHYINVLDFYLQFKIVNNENRVAAKSLQTHLEGHVADPDNSLIGLTPSKSVLSSLISYLDEEAAKEGTPAPSKPDGPFADMFTSHELIEMILRWDEMSDDDAAICMRQFAASARNHGHSLSSLTSPLSATINNNSSSNNLFSLSQSGSFLIPPSSPLPISTSVQSIPKNSSSPALLHRSSSYSAFNNLVNTASPPASPASPRHNTSSSFSLFPTLFKKSLDFRLPSEKTPWKEGDVVVVFVGMVLDPTSKDCLIAEIKAAREMNNFDAFMFARVSETCVDPDQNVSVFIDKDETKTRVVARESMFKIKFEQSSPSMVADVSQQFFQKLSNKLAERTNIFLVSQGLDLEVLERALVNEATFFDTPLLKRNIACVHSLQLLESIAWTNFLDSVRTYAEAKVKRFASKVSSSETTFALARKQILSQLNTFDYAAIPSARLTSYLSASQNALEALNKKADGLLDGSLKQDLSEWYLELIKQAVDDFLIRNGFELDVIPENYIDQAPKDLELVGKNWTMIRDLLDVIREYDCKDHQPHEVIEVMTSLMDSIYARLDEFVRDSLCVVADRLNEKREYFELEENQEVYDELYKQLEEKKTGLDAELRDKIEELMKDLDYIFKIREMEGFQHNGKSRDHVPISGLIASRFFRLENELRTSLDVWGPGREEEEEAQTQCAETSLSPSLSNNFETTAGITATVQ